MIGRGWLDLILSDGAINWLVHEEWARHLLKVKYGDVEQLLQAQLFQI